MRLAKDIRVLRSTEQNQFLLPASNQKPVIQTETNRSTHPENVAGRDDAQAVPVSDLKLDLFGSRKTGEELHASFCHERCCWSGAVVFEHNIRAQHYLSILRNLRGRAFIRADSADVYPRPVT